MNGKLLAALFLQLCLSATPGHASVSITSIGTQGAGDSEDNPAEVGETVTLRCDFTMSSDDSLTNCQWNHIVDDDYLSSSRRYKRSAHREDGWDDGYRDGYRDGYHGDSGRFGDDFQHLDDDGLFRDREDFVRQRARQMRLEFRSRNNDVLAGRWTDDTEDLANVEIKCAGNQGDSGCSTGQAIDSSYASRLDLSISSSSCGLNIRDPQPEDNGEWSCHVFGLDDSGVSRSLDVYVSQLAEVEITDPDERSGDSVEFNIDDENDEIEVTCTAYGGLPRPEFHWYVDDDDHELRSSDFDYVERDGYDRETGMSTIEHTMTWRPTVEDLCEEHELNADICEDDGDRYDDDGYKTFSFDLICRVEQEGLTDSNSNSNAYNSGQTAEIRVEVSAATVAAAAAPIALLAMVAAAIAH